METIQIPAAPPVPLSTPQSQLTPTQGNDVVNLKPPKGKITPKTPLRTSAISPTGASGVTFPAVASSSGVSMAPHVSNPYDHKSYGVYHVSVQDPQNGGVLSQNFPLSPKSSTDLLKTQKHTNNKSANGGPCCSRD